MQYRVLGSSGLLVSPICLGTMTFGSPTSEEEAIRLVHGAIDRGINFIDTANVYEGYSRVLGSKGGVSEEILAKALAGRRDRVVLATKVGSPVGPGPQDRGLSAAHILRELDQSLKRLRTDTIDLYIAHWPDSATPLETTLRAMETAERQGKIRYFGASNHEAWQLCELLGIADRSAGPRVVSWQISFSLLQREYEPDFAFCARHRVGVTPFWVLQGGLLTGKYRRAQPPPPDSRAAEKPEWIWKLEDRVFDRVEPIEALARQLGAPLARYALAWVLSRPAVASAIIGCKRFEQLEHLLPALDVALPAEHLRKLDEISPPPWRPVNPIRA